MPLLDKMYDDYKESSKKKEQNKKKAEKKKERERKKAAARKKNKKIKKKPLTKNEKIIYTILLLICIPLGVIFFVYYNSSLMQTIILAKGLLKTEKNLGLPTDKDKIPYAKSTTPSASNDPSNSQSVFDIMDKEKKKQSGGKRKIQRGGSKFDARLNEAKGFVDPTKFGFPYTWYDNDNLVLRGISSYFITFWTFMRGGLVKLLDICNQSFYKNGYEGHPQDLGGQVFDFAKFTVVLPIISSIIYTGNLILGTGGLFWSAINDQTLLILPWLILGITTLVIGTILTILVTGVTVSYLNIFIAIAFILLTIACCYFWPWGFFWIYSQVMILKITEEKKRLFRNYLKNYELCWILACVTLMGASISYVWDWHIIPKVAFGGVGGTFILLRAMGLF